MNQAALIQQAIMNRPEMGAQSQILPGSPGADPNMAPQQPIPMPQQSPMSGLPQNTPPPPSPLSPEDAEAKMILGALAKRLELHSKIKEMGAQPQMAMPQGIQGM